MTLKPIELMSTKMTPMTSIETGKSDSINNEENKDFGSMLTDAIANVKELEDASNQASYDLAMGYRDDVQNIMLETAKAQTAIEMTVQITTRAVNAYKEILQMNI